MKKTLIALAALAVVSAASAQSSVSIYGILDLGFSSLKTDTGANPATAASTATATVIGNSNQSTSRLGFKGTEDLGGGMAAGFTFETGMTPADGGTLSGFNNRQAFASLSSTTLGTLSIGRQYTGMHAVVAAFSLNGANNVVGDLAYTGDVGKSASSATVATPTTASVGTATQAATQSYTIRASNVMVYTLPASVGFTGVVGYFKNQADTTLGTNDAGYTMAAIKSFGDLTVGAGYTSAVSQVSNAANLASTTDLSVTEWTMDAKYVLGAASLGYQHVSRKVEDNMVLPTVAGSNSLRVIDQVAAAYAITPAANAFVSFGKGTVRAQEGSAERATTAYQLGGNYNLSKRTNLYAIYGNQKLDSAPVAGVTTTAEDKQYAFGVRHSF